MDDEDDMSNSDYEGKEKPREGMKDRSKKKQKTESTSKSAAAAQARMSEKPEDDEDSRLQRAEKRKEKEQRRKEKAARQKEKADAKRARKQEASSGEEPTSKPVAAAEIPNDEEQHEVFPTQHEDLATVDVSGMEDIPGHSFDSSASASPRVDSPLSVESAHPSASSTSSIVPPSAPEEANAASSAKIELPKVDKEELKARLEARIQALREARHADGPNGKPARNRQELLEARRKKEEQRKAHKKELRKQAKDDEMKAKAEAELARLRGSGSPLTPDIFSPRSPPDTNNFYFGRVNFQDGQSMDPALSNVVDHKKRKGPSDTLSAFNAAQKNHARISGLDAAKRADIEEKDAWLNAKKKAHGERPRDDLSLLKKTLKRKQKAKMKSEKEWNNRLEGVKKGKEVRQKKREDNLRKRRDEKGAKGKKLKGVKTKKKARPGFEGSFRGK